MAEAADEQLVIPDFSNVGAPPEPRRAPVTIDGGSGLVIPTGIGAPPPRAPSLADVPASSIMPQGERYVAAVGKGMTDLARGTKQRAMQMGRVAGLVSPEQQAAYQLALEEARRLDEPLMRDWSGVAGSIYGQAAPTAFMPVTRALPSLSSGILPALAQIPKTALGQGAIIGGLQPTIGGESGWLNAGLGGVGGLGAYGLASLVGKGVNAFRGLARDPMEAARIAAAEAEGVPLSLGDVTRSPAVMKLEADLGAIPGSGRQSFLEKQAQALREMIERARARFGSGAPDDSRAILEAMVKRYNEAVELGGAKFNAVGKLATEEGVAPVPLNTVGQRVMDLTAEYPDALSKLRLSKSAKEILDEASLAGPLGRTVEVPFERARQIEKALGELSAQARKQFGMGQINADEFRGIQSVYGGIADDMERWGAGIENRAVKEALDHAKDFWKSNVLPYRQHPVVGTIFKPGTDPATTVADTLDPHMIVDRFLKAGRPELTRSAMELMAPEGRAAARSQVAARILDPAVDPTLTAGLSTRRLETGIGKHESMLPEVFSPEELAYLGRVGGVAGVAERAPTALANPPTGRTLGGGMIGGLAALNPLAAIKLMMGAQGMNKMLTSPTAIRLGTAEAETAARPALTAMGAAGARPGVMDEYYPEMGVSP